MDLIIATAELLDWPSLTQFFAPIYRPLAFRVDHIPDKPPHAVQHSEQPKLIHALAKRGSVAPDLSGIATRVAAT